jgi:putative membrane protein
MKRTFAFALTILLSLAPTFVFAVDSADRKFAANAAMAGLAEIELANLAKQKAKTESVRQYAEHLLSDHQQANEKLKAIAAAKNLSLPGDISADHKAARDKLATLDGPEFEKAYIETMVKDHRKVIGNFQAEAKRTKDPELKAFAVETEPKLREHLEHAQRLQSQFSSNAKR